MVEASREDAGGPIDHSPSVLGSADTPDLHGAEQQQPPEPVGLKAKRRQSKWAGCKRAEGQASRGPSVAESLLATTTVVRCYGCGPTRPFHLRVGAGRACINHPSACARTEGATLIKSG